MVIAIDYDGVINACPYPEVGILVPGAFEGMHRLHEEGHTLILWTCREGTDQTRAINDLLSRGIHIDGVNCNARANIEQYSSDCRKVHADLYVDDRQVGGFPGWEEVLRWVDCMEASNS